MENEVQKIMDQINQLKIKLEMQKLTEQMNKLKAELASAQKPEISENKAASLKQQTEEPMIQSETQQQEQNQLTTDHTTPMTDMQKINAMVLAGLKAQKKKDLANKSQQDENVPKKWSDEQIQEFLNLVRTMMKDNGDIDWVLVGLRCGKSAIHCESKYKQIQKVLSKHEDLTKWSGEHVQELKEVVEAMKQTDEINWDYVGQLCGRSGQECCNQYSLATDSEWTSEQKDILLKSWEQNQTNFDIATVLPALKEHSKRSVQLKLEELTQKSNSPFMAPKTCEVENIKNHQPSTNQRPKNNFLWTQEQLQNLKTVVESMQTHGVDWDLVAQQCGRDPYECRKMYNRQVGIFCKISDTGFNRLQEFRYGDKKWRPFHIRDLKTLVKAAENGRVDWDQVGERLNRNGCQCFNYYVKLTEPKWTVQENEILLKNWEENWEDFDIAAVMPKLGKHTEKGAMFQLEDLTANNDIYLLRYQISRIDRLNYNGQLDFE